MIRLSQTMFALMNLLVPLQAHHSFSAEYDRKKPVKITGAVTKVEWMNPHVYIYVNVTGKDRKITNFGVEGASPNVLRRMRWGKDSVRTGDVITVSGYLAKNGSDTLNAVTVQLADGTSLFAGSSADGEGLPPEK